MKSVFFFFLFWRMKSRGKGCQASCLPQGEDDNQTPDMGTREENGLHDYCDHGQLCSASQVMPVKCPAWAGWVFNAGYQEPQGEEGDEYMEGFASPQKKCGLGLGRA